MERPVSRTHLPLLSIVVPTRNEAGNVAELIIEAAGEGVEPSVDVELAAS